MVRRGTLVLVVGTLIGSVAGPGWAGPDLTVRDSIAGAPPVAADVIDDFDGDGLADVAIGVTGEDPGGAVQVIYGGDTFGPDDEIWTQDSPGIQGASEDFDGFGSALAIGDFDGDGWDDLAVGVPYEAIGSIESAGAVNVLYGGDGGLTSTGNQLWTQNSSGIEGAVEELDQFGSSLAAGDFDGDSYEDLAIGVPEEDVGGDVAAGAVNVIYGSSSGLTSTDNLIWHQDRGAIKDSAEDNDHFGWSLAVGNFNGTTYDDLAVGVPFETLGSRIEAGAVNIIYGSANGLVDQMNQLWTQDSSGVQGAAENLDLLGWSLAAANFGVSTFDDLAIGVPDEGLGSIGNAGAVNVLYGSESVGLTSTGNQLWTQAVSGIEGAAEQGDIFGDALAAGQFDGGDEFDLAIGVPGEDVGDVSHAGAVNVLYGSFSVGLVVGGNQLWDQDSAGILDEAESDESFGRVMATANIVSTSQDELLVGAYLEDVGRADSGALAVIPGSAAGLTSAGNLLISRATPGVEGVIEAGQVFGAALAAG